MIRAAVAYTGAAAVLAFVAAGCDGTSSAGVAHLGAAQTTTTWKVDAHPSKAVVFAASRCMRVHGVPNFPNGITINGHLSFGFLFSSGVKDTPQFQKAHAYCTAKYRLFPPPPPPAVQARWHSQAVTYSTCMRSHGAKDFPDPEPGKGAIDMPTATYLHTPKVSRAQQACRPLFTGKFVFVIPWG